MRKELLYYIKIGKTRGSLFYPVLLAILLFIVLNAVFMYSFGFDNTYFSMVKRVVPYPGMVVGSQYVTYYKYDSLYNINQKVFESVYKLDFGDSDEGKRNKLALSKKTKEEIVNSIIIKKILKGMGAEVISSEINKEYDKVINGISEKRELDIMLRQVIGLSESNIKGLIEYGIAKEKIKSSKLYRAKMKVIAIKVTNINSDQEWKGKEDQVKKISEEIKGDPSKFELYYSLEENRKDAVVDNLGKAYYFSEDVPASLKSSYYGLSAGNISDYIKGDVGFYIIKMEEKRGDFKGTFDEYMEKQKSNIKITDFIR